MKKVRKVSSALGAWACCIIRAPLPTPNSSLKIKRNYPTRLDEEGQEGELGARRQRGVGPQPLAQLQQRVHLQSE